MNLTIGAIALQAISCIAAAQSPLAPASPPEQQLFQVLNSARERNGLEKLEWNAKLAAAAQAHTEELARHGDLSHAFPGELPLEQRVGATGERFDAVAENVAAADNVDDAHLGFMHSPGHRGNILAAKYNAVGIAVVRVKDRVYVTQDFAHVLPTYSLQQFREEVVVAFNRARKAHRFAPVDFRADPRLDDQACAGKLEPGSAQLAERGATRATIFTATRPTDLPPTMENAAADPALRRMDIGVCFRPGQDKFAKFWVVAAFYPSK
ncbi:MAG TPA: CAP domain-containing protein [Candidatus Angelobacter sp.]|nr:CAP domain-containing protein [Candidatus Angelobacter sp.]